MAGVKYGNKSHKIENFVNFLSTSFRNVSCFVSSMSEVTYNSYIHISKLLQKRK